jgi:protein-tyrosine phosphatase
MLLPSLPSILFVCTGNICRSPLAEGVFRHLAELQGYPDIRFDSAGLGNWHVGDPPDLRSIEVARRHGIFIQNQVCRVIEEADHFRFDVILGMDSGHVASLKRCSGSASQAKVALYLDFCCGVKGDVPDPYYGSSADFERVYGMVRAAAEMWFDTVGNASSGQTSSTT